MDHGDLLVQSHLAKQIVYACIAGVEWLLCIERRKRAECKDGGAAAGQLGEHHDAVIAEAWLRKRAKGASSKVAFAAGILASEQIGRQQNYREDWEGSWGKVDRRAQEWLG